MKTIAKYLTPFALLLFLAQYAQAQESGFPSARHAVGFSGGGVIGTGITYRFYFSRSFFQGTFLGRVGSLDEVNDVFAGASYGRILNEITIVKVLPPTALVFISGADGRYLKNEAVNGAESDNEKSFRAGAGIALEIGNTFSPGLLFSVGTTYALAMEQSDSDWDWELGPQFNVGLLYNW